MKNLLKKFLERFNISIREFCICILQAGRVVLQQMLK